jgi:hypothetical protein
MMGWRLVAKAQVSDHLLQHMGRSRANTAIVKVDQRSVGVKTALNFRPVIFIACQIGRGIALRLSTRLSRTGDCISAKSDLKSARNRSQASKKPAPRSHLAATLDV